jgi:murein DD-endopeptidase MepM/ murein hydrolase activator NlpD
MPLGEVPVVSAVGFRGRKASNREGPSGPLRMTHLSRTRSVALPIAVLCVAALLSGPISAQRDRARRLKPAEARPEIKNIFWQPNEVVQGSPVLISVELSGPAREVNGSWLGKRIRFSRSDQPRVWVALAGADVDQSPGSFDVRVSAAMGGRLVRLSKPVEVTQAQFGTGEVQVAQDYVHPTADEQRQIARDELRKKHALGQLTPRPLWRGNFTKPVDAEPTPSFGETRLMNEEKESHHLGTDFPAKEGTSVYASNAGVVVLAAPLFYEGNCVIVDHGDRLFTVYMHLEKMNVHRGERIRKRARIGLSGRTGRVTGPHLHFEVVWNGSHLDPVRLLALTLPEAETVRRRPGAR